MWCRVKMWTQGRMCWGLEDYWVCEVNELIAQPARGHSFFYLYLLTLHNYVHCYPIRPHQRNSPILLNLTNVRFPGCYYCWPAEDLFSMCAEIIVVYAVCSTLCLLVAYTLFLVQVRADLRERHQPRPWLLPAPPHRSGRLAKHIHSKYILCSLELAPYSWLMVLRMCCDCCRQLTTSSGYHGCCHTWALSWVPASTSSWLSFTTLQRSLPPSLTDDLRACYFQIKIVLS